MLNSREGLKKYFLPVYLVWAFLTPTLMILMRAYVFAAEGQALFEAVDWQRVPSMYALFGIIWPLTIVISPAFILSFERETGYSFLESLGSLSDPLAMKMMIASFFFYFAWIGPVVSFIVAVLFHKKYLEKGENKPLSWGDYLGGFL